jgi:hypothetical protein
METINYTSIPNRKLKEEEEEKTLKLFSFDNENIG